MQKTTKILWGVITAVLVVVVVAVILAFTLKTDKTNKIEFTAKNAIAQVTQGQLNGQNVQDKMQAIVFSTDSTQNNATTDRLKTWSNLDLKFNEDKDDITISFNIVNQNPQNTMDVTVSYDKVKDSKNYTMTVSSMLLSESTSSALSSGKKITLNTNELVNIIVVFSVKDKTQEAIIEGFKLGISLESQAIQSTPEETGPRYTVIDADNSGTVNFGDTINFGYYPTTIKAQDVTVNESSKDANGYYTGSDGAKYQKVVCEVSSVELSDGTTTVIGESYFFKVEPIQWQVLSVSNNGIAYLFSKNVIDEQHGSNTNTYAESGLSSWLNDEFLNKAFTQYEQEIIQDMTVEGINQDVKISLIGDDIINPEYGFDPTAQSLISDEDREKEATDYSSILPRSIYHHEKAYFIRDVLSTHGTPYTSITPEGQLYAYYYNEIYGIAPVLYIALDNVNIE